MSEVIVTILKAVALVFALLLVANGAYGLGMDAGRAEVLQRILDESYERDEGGDAQ